MTLHKGTQYCMYSQISFSLSLLSIDWRLVARNKIKQQAGLVQLNHLLKLQPLSQLLGLPP